MRIQAQGGRLPDEQDTIAVAINSTQSITTSNALSALAQVSARVAAGWPGEFVDLVVPIEEATAFILSRPPAGIGVRRGWSFNAGRDDDLRIDVENLSGDNLRQ